MRIGGNAVGGVPSVRGIISIKAEISTNRNDRTPAIPASHKKRNSRCLGFMRDPSGQLYSRNTSCFETVRDAHAGSKSAISKSNLRRNRPFKHHRIFHYALRLVDVPGIGNAVRSSQYPCNFVYYVGLGKADGRSVRAPKTAGGSR